MDVKEDEGVLNERGAIDIEKDNLIIFTADSNSYYRVGDKIQDAFTTKDLRKS